MRKVLQSLDRSRAVARHRRRGPARIEVKKKKTTGTALRSLFYIAGAASKRMQDRAAIARIREKAERLRAKRIAGAV